MSSPSRAQAAATTSTSPTQRVIAECTVCGAESQTRCSSCYSESGLSLYFCSKEHQKLIWPYHRLVCGKRAHPFHLPPFDPEEAMLLVYRLEHDTDEGGDERQRQVVLRAFAARDIKATRGPMPAVIDGEIIADYANSLLGVEGPPCPVVFEDVAPAYHTLPWTRPKSYLVGVYRSIGVDGGWDPSNNLDFRSPRTVFVEEVSKLFAGYSDNFELDPSTMWHSELCHRLAAKTALFLRRRGSSSSPAERAILSGLECSVVERLRKFLRETTAPELQEFCAASEVLYDIATRDPSS
ncbi:hypothetical protein JCM10908_001391 [Rhodotorula pacifica]|uniref:zinc finger MYND domain-containing protein n=1 Tax=Rhodotorula pacifica TaxID=1495444 RepID=UPI00317117EF